MDTSSDTILAYLAGTLDAAQRAALEAGLADDRLLARRVDRLRFSIDTLRRDASEPVPSDAVSAAKGLGRRLDALRAPSALERLSAAVGALVARVVFDSRLEGSLVGLRGASGFAITAAIQGVEVELECSPLGGDRFGVMGQVSGTSASRIEAFSESLADAQPARIAEATIDADGVFRLQLPTGRYLLRAHTQTKPIDLVDIDVP